MSDSPQTPHVPNDVGQPLAGARVWLATRADERAIRHRAALSEALLALGASGVHVVSVEGLVRGAAAELGQRAGVLIEGAAQRIARLVGAATQATPTGVEPEPATPDADLVLVDDPRITRGLRAFLKLKRGTPLLVGLETDFEVDPAWRAAGVHALVVPHDALRAALGGDQAAAPIAVAGPPVDPALAPPAASGPDDLAAAKTAIGADPARPLVLVLAEGMEADLLGRIAFQLTLPEPAPSALFYYGSDEGLAPVLRERAAAYGLAAGMFGAVPDLGAYFRAADLVVAAADDPALFEWTVAARPLLVAGPAGDSPRAQFLADRGALLWARDVVQLGVQIEELLGADPARVEALRAAVAEAAALVPADGCARIAEAVASLYANRAELMRASDEAPAAPSPADDAQPPSRSAPAPPRHAAFETIGASDQAPGLEAHGGLSLAEAKDQMAALILQEREAERALTEASRTRDLWLRRAELASASGDASLFDVAELQLAKARAEVSRRNREIDTIRRSKDKLKVRAGARRAPASPSPTTAEPLPAPPTAGSSDIEARFRSMEVDRDLDRLRRKIRGDADPDQT
jgi:hypothetical protein